MSFKLVERATLCGGVGVLLIKQTAGSSSVWHVVELTPVEGDDCTLDSFLLAHTGQHSERNRWATFVDAIGTDPDAEAKAHARYDAWKEGGPDA